MQHVISCQQLSGPCYFWNRINNFNVKWTRMDIKPAWHDNHVVLNTTPMTVCLCPHILANHAVISQLLFIVLIYIRKYNYVSDNDVTGMKTKKVPLLHKRWLTSIIMLQCEPLVFPTPMTWLQCQAGFTSILVHFTLKKSQKNLKCKTFSDIRVYVAK